MNRARVCCVCGRRFAWRRKWARDWERVRYCSVACRRRGLRPLDRRIEQELLALLGNGRSGGCIDPADVERRLVADGMPRRNLRQPLRMAARRLYHAGRIDILQSGRRVDPDKARGPLTLRLATGN